MDLLIDFAKIGLGIACVIRSFVREELASGELVEIPIPFEIPSRQVGFLYSSAAAENPALDQFLSFCSQRRVPYALPGKCPFVQTWQPIAGLIAAKKEPAREPSLSGSFLISY